MMGLVMSTALVQSKLPNRPETDLAARSLDTCEFY